AEQQTALAGQHPGLVDGPVGQRHLGAGGDVQAGFHDAVVAEGDADAGVGADQAALPDGDDLLAATGEGAHDRGPAAQVGTVRDDHAGGDPTFHHGGAEGAGVEVDEALVHHGGSAGQVSAQPDPVGVADPHPGRDHVVHHARELVDAVYG